MGDAPSPALKESESIRETELINSSATQHFFPRETSAAKYVGGSSEMLNVGWEVDRRQNLTAAWI